MLSQIKANLKLSIMLVNNFSSHYYYEVSPKKDLVNDKRE